MATRLNTGALQRLAGLATWALVTGFSLYLAAANGYEWLVPLALALVNLGAMWVAMGDHQPARRLCLVALWVQLASAMAMGWLLPVSFLPIYTIIWIAMATAYYPLRVCWWLLAGVTVAWYAILRFGWSQDDALITVVLYGTFHLFAMLTATNAHEADAARHRVEELNRELMATQALLAEATRQGERTRIARDLHDLLGHHLTALSLNLQIAERLTEGEPRQKVEQCRALVRLLLSDVRDTVSALRDDSRVDVAAALRALADDVPGLDVEIDIDEGLCVENVDVAETLLRCVQEAITNTLRHAGASRIWIRIAEDGGSLTLDVRDNGQVADGIEEGNGLRGMRERLAQCRGTLAVNTAGSALCLRAEIPLGGSAA